MCAARTISARCFAQATLSVWSVSVSAVSALHRHIVTSTKPPSAPRKAWLKEQGYKVYAIEQVDDSMKLDALPERLGEKVAIIFGNEVEGVQEELLPLCDGSIEIPQQGTKHSLNVSCAAAIVLWEFFKMLCR